MDSTIGENGLVPFWLVFGITTRFPIIGHDLPAQRKRMNNLAKAQKGMNAFLPRRRILSTLERILLQYADFLFKIWENVLVCSEKRSHWIGRFLVVNVD